MIPYTDLKACLNTFSQYKQLVSFFRQKWPPGFPWRNSGSYHLEREAISGNVYIFFIYENKEHVSG